jgi:tripartite-type tricarboxylate transporter receptor subunit TctC
MTCSPPFYSCKKAASRFWDGSVIGVVSNNHVVNSVYKNIPFDSLADITPITIISATPFVLVAHPSVPTKNVQELIAYAKSKPGCSTTAHRATAPSCTWARPCLWTRPSAIQHIPYKGMGPLMNDVLGGQVQLAVVAVAPAAAHIKSGAAGHGRDDQHARGPLPGVPDHCRARPARLRAGRLDCPVAPAGLPKTELARLYNAFKAAMEMPEARDALVAQGYEIKLTPPDAAAAFFRSEARAWRRW